MITSKPILLKFGSSYFKLVKYDSYCDTHSSFGTGDSYNNSKSSRTKTGTKISRFFGHFNDVLLNLTIQYLHHYSSN